MARIPTGLNAAQGTLCLRDREVTNRHLSAHSGLVPQKADHQFRMHTLYVELESVLPGRTHPQGAQAPAAARLLPAADRQDHIRIERILGELSLTHLRCRHPQSLSAGEKQRAVIACALIKDLDALISPPAARTVPTCSVWPACFGTKPGSAAPC